MTVQEIINIFNIKPKKTIPGDYIVTTDDILKGNIFQKFINHENFTSIVNGLNIVDGNVVYTYAKLNRIEIDVEDEFPQCGGRKELNVMAFYSLHNINSDGFDNTSSEEKSSIVHALITLDNELFTYEKSYLVNETANNGDATVEVNIHATYYHKSIKYEATKHVVQLINKSSSWLIEKEPTQYISLHLDKNIISKEGGIINATVERGFSRQYYMKDSCGNIIGRKNEPDLTEDITDKCLITCSDRKNTSTLKNIIKIYKQNAGAAERNFVVSARYLDFTSTDEILQEEGGKVTYKKELSFENDKKNKFVDLSSSIPSKTQVSIISKLHKYADEIYEGFEYDNDLIISKDESWVNANAIKTDKGVFIEVETTETNTDKVNDREAILSITNGNDEIKLIVSQPSLTVIDEIYGYDYFGSNTYECFSLNNEEIYFHPYKAIIYENKEKEKIEIEKNIDVKFLYTSSNSSLLDIKKIEKIGENYYPYFFNMVKESIKNVSIKIKPYFIQDDRVIFNGKETLITVKGNDIIDYNYELCFDEHNKFKAVNWHETTEPKFVNYNSFKYTLTNGIITNKENVPIKIGYFDENGKEQFDNTFSIKTFPDRLMIFPIKTNNSISKEYVITQKETGDKINLNLSFTSKEETHNVYLKVIVYCENVKYDIWTGENGYLIIDNSMLIKLNPCWLSPNMKDKKDIAYKGFITLSNGKHTFEAINISLLNKEMVNAKLDCKKDIYIDNSTKDIIFDIKCP